MASQELSPALAVDLVCIKEGGKLRVRIVSPGYYNDANCQFPRDLREENTRYRVSVFDITLVTSRGKYYYSIRNRAGIQVIARSIDRAALRIYEDTSTPDCAVCFDAPKACVLYPCGHFYTCMECGRALHSCPICRAAIVSRLNKTDMD